MYYLNRNFLRQTRSDEKQRSAGDSLRCGVCVARDKASTFCHQTQHGDVVSTGTGDDVTDLDRSVVYFSDCCVRLGRARPFCHC